MKVRAFALAAGILWGFLLFAFTLLEASRGAALGHTLSALGALYIGYSVTYLGSVIGLVYGFVSGAIVGGAFCWLYNRCGGASDAPKAG